MHHALRVSEIIHIICENSKKSSLPAMARTCRTFCPLALDTLWAELDNVLPLIKCLPPEFCAEEGGIVHWGKGVCLTEANRTRFLRYSHRVRALSWVCYPPGQNSSRNIDPKVLQIFSLLGGAKPPFPHLKCFFWSDDCDENIPFITLFVGPSLHNLRLEFVEDLGTHHLVLLSTLGYRCPQLKSLHLEFDRGSVADDKAGVAAFSQALCGLEHLEDLQCFELEENAWRHILRLPSLADLEVNLTPFSLTEFLPAARVHHGTLFPNIRNIGLICAAPTAITEFLEYMHIAPRKVEMALSSAPMGDMPGLFVALSQHCGHRSLQHIKIWDQDGPGNTDITLEHVQALFCFGDLRTLELKWFHSFSLDDHVLSDMAISWPMLESLHLEGAGHWRTKSKITFHGIITLVKRCPRLHHLHLEINATKLTSSGLEELRNATPNYTVRELHVGNSLINDSEGVAVRLFDLFPELDRIVPWTGEGPQSARRRRLWKKVAGHLKVFRMVREQTRWRDRRTT
ncbi:hypothetical protein BV22DRAFT_1196089 [Leucogyrophana mollusca]|uniref:Uncharacterized protein n=1 Tax=Leucogyrophana mollusca TaxID=85980 RepID=A0ACB8BFZ8_9AGAM|nr:hypothetical protein BV22DRAFT_1196089 [Leucogyrophana mollusca]